MIFTFEISAGPGNKYDRLKPIALVWKVKQTSLGPVSFNTFEACWEYLSVVGYIIIQTIPSELQFFLKKVGLSRSNRVKTLWWFHAMFKFIKQSDKLWGPWHQRYWFTVVLFQKFPQWFQLYLKVGSILMYKFTIPMKYNKDWPIGGMIQSLIRSSFDWSGKFPALVMSWSTYLTRFLKKSHFPGLKLTGY